MMMKDSSLSLRFFLAFAFTLIGIVKLHSATTVGQQHMKNSSSSLDPMSLSLCFFCSCRYIQATFDVKSTSEVHERAKLKLESQIQSKVFSIFFIALSFAKVELGTFFFL
jgi:hypothetical protein